MLLWCERHLLIDSWAYIQYITSRMGPKKSKKGRYQVIKETVQMKMQIKSKSSTTKSRLSKNNLVHSPWSSLLARRCWQVQSRRERDKGKSDVPPTRSQKRKGENVYHRVDMVTFRSAMTHQYKQMQKEYNDELDSLNKTLQEREEELSSWTITQKKTTKPSPSPKKNKTKNWKTKKTKS